MHFAVAGVLRGAPDHGGHVFRLQVDAQALDAANVHTLDHGGLHKQREDVAHADALRLPLDVECLGQALDKKFAG